MFNVWKRSLGLGDQNNSSDNNTRGSLALKRSHSTFQEGGSEASSEPHPKRQKGALINSSALVDPEGLRAFEIAKERDSKLLLVILANSDHWA